MLPNMEHPNLLVGTATGDDAAVYQITDDLAIIQTADFFPPIVDDPYWYGAISAANSLSDIYAMGGRPIMALNLLCFPVTLDREILGLILKGGHEKAHEAGVIIAGGHTIDDVEPKYGMTVTGLVKPGEQIGNNGARAGDSLVLTKPIGTGIITTASKNDKATKEVVQKAIEVMATLNKAACEAMISVGVNACTDVTGFGLLGHLRRIADESKVTAHVNLRDVPVLPGTVELLEDGNVPGGTVRNLDSLSRSVKWHPGLSQNSKLLLADAQTSGGLLISLPSERVSSLFRELEDRGVQGSVIGEITSGGQYAINVEP